jgi:hypothetical protein
MAGSPPPQGNRRLSRGARNFEGQAAFLTSASTFDRNGGYQRQDELSDSSLNTRVRIWSRKWALRLGLRHLLLTIRLLITFSTADSIKPEAIVPTPVSVAPRISE